MVIATPKKCMVIATKKIMKMAPPKKFMPIFSFAQVHSSETGEGSEVRAIMLKSHIVKFLSPEQGMSSEISQDQGMSFKISQEQGMSFELFQDQRMSFELFQDQGMSCPPSTERPPPLGANSRQPSKLSLDLLQVNLSTKI